jgi:hypothetical protein
MQQHDAELQDAHHSSSQPLKGTAAAAAAAAAVVLNAQHVHKLSVVLRHTARTAAFPNQYSIHKHMAQLLSSTTGRTQHHVAGKHQMPFKPAFFSCCLLQQAVAAPPATAPIADLCQQQQIDEAFCFPWASPTNRVRCQRHPGHQQCHPPYWLDCDCFCVQLLNVYGIHCCCCHHAVLSRSSAAAAAAAAVAAPAAAGCFSPVQLVYRCTMCQHHLFQSHLLPAAW